LLINIYVANLLKLSLIENKNITQGRIELSQKKILVIPPAGSLARWDARKKARVVIAVRSGTLSRGEAYDRYLLSEEELSQWGEAFDREGIAGLQIKSRSDRRVRSRTDEIAPAAPVRAQEGPSRASGIEALESELVGSEHHRRTVRGPRKSR
jgi:transposase